MFVSSENLPQNAETTVIASLEMRPIDAPVQPDHFRDVGLWALIEGQPNEAKLAIRYRVLGGNEPYGRIFVSSSLPMASNSRHGLEFHGAGLERLTAEALSYPLKLAFPGFRSVATPLQVLDHQARLCPSSLRMLAPQSTTSEHRGLRLVGENEPASLPFPKVPLSQLNLDAGLQALSAIACETELVLMLSRFFPEHNNFQRLFEADQKLFGMLNSPGADVEMLNTAANLRRTIADWNRSSHGFRLEVFLQSAAALDDITTETVRRTLFGDCGRIREGQPEETILIECFPAEAVARPHLTPSPQMLTGLGYRSFRVETPAVSADELRLGEDLSGHPVTISRQATKQHMVVLGATGVGKSTLFCNMILQDISAGVGVILIDPHGPLFSEVAAKLPPEIAANAILADAGDFANPFSLNLLEIKQEPAAIQRNFIANQLISLFKSMLYKNVPEAFGPMFEAYFRNALMLLMDAEGENASLADFDRVFSDAAYRRELIHNCNDEFIVRFWRGIATKTSGDIALENIAPYICSKLTQFTSNPLLRPILTARKSTLDFASAMDKGQPCLISLARGSVGELDAALLGGILTIRVFAEAMARGARPQSGRRPVRLYLDEFSYAGSVLSQMLAECRKFGIELVLANQGLGQIDGRNGGLDISHALLANVASVLTFRVGPEDATRLADWFAPEVTARTLTRLPNHMFAARLLRGGVPQSVRRVIADPPATEKDL
ncbi:MAG: DUF87 domain-containing protein [Marinosulfonomonas sp.]|nr:DUF87 domain-containing protein [Marinosulfonomonas sp.]